MGNHAPFHFAAAGLLKAVEGAHAWVAAIGGMPWFTVARMEGIRLAMLRCCNCAATGPLCRPRAHAICCGVARALMPPWPPL